jgi:hypothetical protein
MSLRVVPKIPKLSEIPSDQVSPVVLNLLEICHHFQELLHGLRDEIARLKGEKARPKIKPSKLEDDPKDKEKSEPKKPRETRKKTADLEINDTIPLPPEGLPAGSRFKGYEYFTQQGIKISLYNVLYKMERWITPTGESLVGKLPAGVDGEHYNQPLRVYILHQYYHCLVTQPLILEQIREWGIKMSAGQLSAILIKDKEKYHAEKEDLLRAGLETSSYVHVDDTGARHQGHNGYCTHIGNELFAYFASTQSKSRINFLELLRAGADDYVLNEEALAYMRAQKLPQPLLDRLIGMGNKSIAGKEWSAFLADLGIKDCRHIKIATEGALLGSVLDHGINPNLAIVSDDAGQFDILRHGLCWIHAERVFVKLIGFDDAQRAAIEKVRTEIWDYYRELKAYKSSPDEEKKALLDAKFDEICATKTCFVSLNLALQRMHRNKAELLLVLERPELPLNNNLSERDIREYVKRRIISGSTRSTDGRRCRDTFASLKKTSRKLGISFWDFLSARVSGRGDIPPLGELIRRHACAPSGCQPGGP